MALSRARAAVCVAVLAGAVCAQTNPGDTAVLKWKDGKRAAFFLAFDDSCRTHVSKAIPELGKRGMVGTFYINPGKGPFLSERKAWELDLPKNPAVVYGNHTFTHVGATNAAQLEVELARCEEVIRACYPAAKPVRLVSFGRPGGVPWTVTEAEKREALARHHLIERPAFFSYPFHVKTGEEVCRLVDQAIAKGDAGHLDFHGVDGDWLSTPMAVFSALLDKLEACRGEVWMTDHISCHKYRTERDGAKVQIVRADGDGIRLTLTSEADPSLYDLPLTLETRVPSGWQACRVTQGAVQVERPVADGRVRYEAVPGGGEIVLSRR